MSDEPLFTQLPISADSRPTTSGEQTALWIVGMVFGGLMLGALAQQYVPQKLSMVFFLLLWPLMLVAHEVGHAAMARLLGWHVGHMSIGFGPVIWRGQVGRTAVIWRALPVEGFVIPAPSTARGARWKSALIYAAGPGIEIAVLGGLVAWLGLDIFLAPSDAAHVIALKTLAVVIIWGAGFNLLPFATGGGVSDGLGILLSPFMTRESIELRLLALDEMDIDELAEKGDVTRAVARLDALIAKGQQVERLQDRAIAVLAGAGRFADAQRRLDTRVAGRSTVELDDVGLLHLQALTLLAAPKPDAVNVDLALNRALRFAPGNPSLRVTRGVADIRRGDSVGGGNQLADVYRDIEAPMDRARALGWLAVASRRIGHRDAEQRFSTAFEHVNKHAGLAAEVGRALDRTYQ